MSPLSIAFHGIGFSSPTGFRFTTYPHIAILTRHNLPLRIGEGYSCPRLRLSYATLVNRCRIVRAARAAIVTYPRSSRGSWVPSLAYVKKQVARFAPRAAGAFPLCRSVDPVLHPAKRFASLFFRMPRKTCDGRNPRGACEPIPRARVSWRVERLVWWASLVFLVPHTPPHRLARPAASYGLSDPALVQPRSCHDPA